jgi:hypothetical protein
MLQRIRCLFIHRATEEREQFGLKAARKAQSQSARGLTKEKKGSAIKNGNWQESEKKLYDNFLISRANPLKATGCVVEYLNGRSSLC